MKHKIITLTVVLVIALTFASCTLKRAPMENMFPAMTHLEVYNAGECIGNYDGYVQLKMGSISNNNVYGHDFILEYYEVYVDGRYIESFVDSDAMAFKYKREVISVSK